VFEEEDVKSVATEIMMYLHQRPMASDSLEGITYWWLVQQAILKNKELVEQALEQLEKEGILSKENNHRNTIYSLNPNFKPVRK